MSDLPPALAALRAEALKVSCESWAIRKRWPLTKGSERVGACPKCGDGGKKAPDRFSINPHKNVWNCRQCDKGGGDVISLVMWTEGVDFVPALEIITGRKASEPADPEKIREAEAESERQAEKNRGIEEAKRQAAIEAGMRIIRSARPLRHGGPVSYYLTEQRGIAGLPASVRLGEIVEHDYWDVTEQRVLHRGPAMIAAVVQNDRRVTAAHQTWLDPRQPKGKLALPDADNGRERPAKKVRGSKKGGSIHLYTPAFPTGPGQRPGPTRLVMGEGIETTLTALAHNFEDGTAYWAGVDLGNMAGRAARDANHKQLHDQPDMDDRECFLPPDWVEELIYLADSDEPETRTIEKLTRGLRRARRLRLAAGGELTIKIVLPLEAGKDLNDLVMVGDEGQD